MSLPGPLVTLNGHCSVIYNDTLYTYQPDVFQALPLHRGGRWSQLSMGVAVTGGECVLTASNGQDAALFVVGGTTSPTTKEYSGLQKYVFADQRWQSYILPTSVTQNRQMHGAAYLNSSSSILVYGGSQDDNRTASSQTFTISTKDPGLMKAFPSNAPPGKQPILLPWNHSHAAMIGGSPGNKQVWTFGDVSGWQQLYVTLPSSLSEISKEQAAIVAGSDGSKALQLFDMSQSPNQITTLLLESAGGQSLFGRGVDSQEPELPQPDRRPPRKRRRRDLTLTNWPAYNGTLAPQTTRNGFSLAQGSSGLVVVSGGQDRSVDDPLCIFNQTGNGWVNAKEFFNPTLSATTNISPSPTSLVPSSTAPAPAPAPAAPIDTPAGRNRTLLILGGTLGAAFGLIALLLLVLFIFRWRRLRRKRHRPRRLDDSAPDAKNQMDFADRGAEFMAAAGGSFGPSHSHQPTDSDNSHISTFIAEDGHQPKRGVFHNAADSNRSAGTSLSRTRSRAMSPSFPTSTQDPLPVAPIINSPSPEARTEPRTDEGWSKYFMNNSTATDLARGPLDFAQSEALSRPTTYTTASQSDYTNHSRVPSSHLHESAEVQPLSIRGSHYPAADTMRESADMAPPPTRNGLSFVGQSDQEYTNAHPTSHHDGHEEFLDESSGPDSWTPVATSDRGSGWGDRGSSIYADSAIYPHPGDRVLIPSFPGVPASNRTSQVTVIPVGHQRGLRSVVSKDFAGGVSKLDDRPPEESMRRAEPDGSPSPHASSHDTSLWGTTSQSSSSAESKPPVSQVSSIRGLKPLPVTPSPGSSSQGSQLLPRPAGDAYGAHRGSRPDGDMSWLNLER